jgi:regulatory protein
MRKRQQQPPDSKSHTNGLASEQQTTNGKRQTVFTPAVALEHLRSWCAYQERCQQEARDKLYDLGIKKEDVEAIISTLISEKFIDEERFAAAFAGGKFRIKKWGRIKIRSMLKMKRISEYSINKALDQITDENYLETLEQLIETKKRSIRESNKIKLNYKLLRFAQSRGFETDVVMQLLNKN